MTIKLGNERYLTITFNKNNIKNGYCVYHNNAVKFVDSHYYKIIDFFGLTFVYHDFNYDEVLHIILRSTDKFSGSSCASEVAKLQIALKTFVDNEHLSFKTKPPFSFAVEDSFDDGGVMYSTYYITVTKQWLLTHNLYSIVNPFIRKVFIDEYIQNANKFPKYSKYKKEIIFL